MEAIVARGIQILAALGGAYLIALWFVLIVWTFRDIETRSKNVITQIFSTLLVVLFFVPGVLLYMILRPKETLDAAFQRSLEEEYLLQDLEELPLCQHCQHYVEDDYMICPHCQSLLREACVACSRLVDLRWTVCPYCSTEQKRLVREELEKVPDVATRWVVPARLRRRTATQLPHGPAVQPGLRDREPATPQVAISTIRGGNETVVSPPVRLFDRRKTREAVRLNGYQRPASLQVHGAVAVGAALVDQHGRSLEQDLADMNGHVAGVNGNGSERLNPVRVSIASEETGD